MVLNRSNCEVTQEKKAANQTYDGAKGKGVSREGRGRGRAGNAKMRCSERPWSKRQGGGQGVPVGFNRAE